MGYDWPVNGWVVVAVLLLGGALALAPTVWSWLDPTSPARTAERLLVVLSSWNGIRDLVAHVVLRGVEGETAARVTFLAPANLRLDVLAPESLAGTVFALRPVGEEWLFVHYRPGMDLGIEARLAAQELTESLHLPAPAEVGEGLRRGEIQVSYAPAAGQASPTFDEYDLVGLPGPFPRIVLRVDPPTSLPRGVALYADLAQTPTLTVEVARDTGTTDPAGEWLLEVNTGLGLRDVFRLDPLPHRWLAPTPLPPGG